MAEVDDFKTMFRRARLAKGAQQNDIAKALGIVPAYVSRLEKGLSLPSNDLILKMGTVLDMDIQKVFLQVMLEKTDSEEIQRIIRNFQSVSLVDTDDETGMWERKISKLSEKEKKIISNLVDNLSVS